MTVTNEWTEIINCRRMFLTITFVVNHCLHEQPKDSSQVFNKMWKSKVFFWISLAVFGDFVNCQLSEWSASASEQTFGHPPKHRQPNVLTTTPGDICREFMGSDMAIWASYAYRTDVCSRPISCRLRDNFIIRTRPGSPPEGMLCALHLRDDGNMAVKFVCHRGDCVREQPS